MKTGYDLTMLWVVGDEAGPIARFRYKSDAQEFMSNKAYDDGTSLSISRDDDVVIDSLPKTDKPAYTVVCSACGRLGHYSYSAISYTQRVAARSDALAFIRQHRVSAHTDTIYHAVRLVPSILHDDLTVTLVA